MTISTVIEDGAGTSTKAKVTSRGQLVVAPLEFSTSHPVTMDAVDTAFSFAGPVQGQRFVMTGILVDAGRNVSSSTAGTVVVYEATEVDETTVEREILTIEMLKNTNRVITGVNLICSEGRWINIKTTDATITASLLGYYVDA